MRLLLASTVMLTLACGTVPDVTFASNDDAATSADAPADQANDGPLDAATGFFDTCPASPPNNQTICCGSVVCMGTNCGGSVCTACQASCSPNALCCPNPSGKAKCVSGTVCN